MFILILHVLFFYSEPYNKEFYQYFAEIMIREIERAHIYYLFELMYAYLRKNLNVFCSFSIFENFNFCSPSITVVEIHM